MECSIGVGSARGDFNVMDVEGEVAWSLRRMLVPSL